jgi:hypothetical protein
MRRSCRSEKGMWLNMHDVTLLSVLLTLPAPGGRIRPETARIQELRVRPVGLQPPPRPIPFFDAERADRTLVCAWSSPLPRSGPSAASIASRKTLSTVLRMATARDLPTGANNERSAFSTAVLTKSCAKCNPARLRRGTRHLEALEVRTPESIVPSRLSHGELPIVVCMRSDARTARAVFTYVVFVVTK